METRPDTHSSDDSMRALDLIEAAWDEGEVSGIPAELIAYAAVFTGIRDLVAIFGKDAAAAMASNLADRINKGDFSAGDAAKRDPSLH